VGYVITLEGRELSVEITDAGATVALDGTPHNVELLALDEPSLFSLLVDGHSHEVQMEDRGNQIRVLLDGRLYEVKVESEASRRFPQRPARLAEPAELVIRTPMPGVVVDVPVSEGDSVQDGQVLAIVESMKMENEMRCTRDGQVRSVQVRAGEMVAQSQVLVVVE